MTTTTYLGRRCEVRETRISGGLYGRRIVWMRWIDDATPENGGYKAGTITETEVEGDGTKPETFVVHVPTHVVGEATR